MSQIRLHVDNVTKAYRQYQSDLQRFLHWCGLRIGRFEQTKVLKNVSFTVAEGEAVALIGENGAGKSTMLKIITGTVRPTIGRVGIRGKVSAILELGLGFNPEMTGRQNVYLAAGMMGFRQAEIDDLVDEIKDFSELIEYFDRPVRTYSSGMQMRLAFSIATCVRPEILIIDEALSVGDAYFQHKSFDRIRKFREAGTSLLFVSHDKGAVQTLCDRAILLEKGSVIKDGPPQEVIDFYNALIAEKENMKIEVKALSNGKMQTLSGTGEATVREVVLYNSKGEPTDLLHIGECAELHIEVQVHKDIDSLVLGYSIKDRLGQVMYGTNTWHTKQVISNAKAKKKYKFVISFPINLGVGSYSIQTALVDRDTHLTANYDWREFAYIFNVINIDKDQFEGCVWNEVKICFEEMDSLSIPPSMSPSISRDPLKYDDYKEI